MSKSVISRIGLDEETAKYVRYVIAMHQPVPQANNWFHSGVLVYVLLVYLYFILFSFFYGMFSLPSAMIDAFPYALYGLVGAQIFLSLMASLHWMKIRRVRKNYEYDYAEDFIINANYLADLYAYRAHIVIEMILVSGLIYFLVNLGLYIVAFVLPLMVLTRFIVRVGMQAEVRYIIRLLPRKNNLTLIGV
ncbi:MAG: hypothetical protein NUV82_03810 [Candidatus Komeilibacteria bacterium]|nr:hypothetical protein [Candidatus Komeilibacteria bacterium]